MNCANHPEVPATAYCRDCGKPMCHDCQVRALGTVYCGEHAPATVTVTSELPSLPRRDPGFAAAPPPPREEQTYPSAPPPGPENASSPYTAPEPPPQCDANAHPALAFLLGFIPGVGALYNGQYAKGLIHAVVFGMLVTVASRGVGVLEPLVGILIGAWVFYMAFEAYHTAARRRKGQPVDEFSSLLEVSPSQGRFPAGALLLIGIGFVLLLDTTGIIDRDVLAQYWPVGLILLGVYMIYGRVSSQRQVR